MNTKHRRVDHGGAPFFTVGQLEQKSETTDHFGLLGNIGIAACLREAADDWHTSTFEDYGL